MNSGELTLSAGALSMAVLEGVKFLVKYFKKDPNYSFPTWFYAIMLPVLNAVAPFALVAIGFPSDAPVLTLDLKGVILYVVRVAVASLVSLVAYNGGLKPLKTYDRQLRELP